MTTPPGDEHVDGTGPCPSPHQTLAHHNYFHALQWLATVLSLHRTNGSSTVAYSCLSMRAHGEWSPSNPEIYDFLLFVLDSQGIAVVPGMPINGRDIHRIPAHQELFEVTVMRPALLQFCHIGGEPRASPPTPFLDIDPAAVQGRPTLYIASESRIQRPGAAECLRSTRLSSSGSKPLWWARMQMQLTCSNVAIRLRCAGQSGQCTTSTLRTRWCLCRTALE